jgi:hypothetical protein
MLNHVFLHHLDQMQNDQELNLLCVLQLIRLEIEFL